MNKFSPHLLLLVCTALSLPATASVNDSGEPQQSAEAEKPSRRQVLEEQKKAVDALNLPPAQAPSEPPAMLDLPVDHNDSPGAVKK